MTTPIALLLAALLLAGIGLFVRAWLGGMRFGERLEARKNTAQAAQASEPEQEPPSGS
jgi:uncharacterized membrane protein YcjF (UPF0283 family)